MTRQPWTIAIDATLSQARQLMREHHIEGIVTTVDGLRFLADLLERETCPV